ncbi:Peter pan-like protein, partial [Thalictrum thalictroides]
AGYGSESEADDEAATVTLSSDLGRVNRASNKSAVRLQEIGPRMTLELMKIEEGMCSGGIIFNEYGNGDGAKKEANQEKEEMDEEE